MVFLKKIIKFVKRLNNLKVETDEIKYNQGLILAKLNSSLKSDIIQDYEFKVFSQWGEDGIIQHLINNIEIKNKNFIEFGVEDFMESNCRFLMLKDGWSGFVIDGSEDNINRLRSSHFYWKHELHSVAAFITRDNINDLLSKSGFAKDIGILSIDLDGNDYYIYESITEFNPRILIVEFNSTFGPERKISVPYDEKFYRTKAHYSNLYWGASLSALNHIASQKGYSLVGTNSASNNAFFVRNDLLNTRIKATTVNQCYKPSKFRESRDVHGKLTYISSAHRFDVIKGLPVFNVENQQIELL